MTNRAFWSQGEVQVGRPSARALGPEDEWAQTCLIPPMVVEIQVRLGLMRAENHMRWQIEVLDPASGELLAMQSRPGCKASSYDHELAAIWRKVDQVIREYVGPDPF